MKTLHKVLKKGAKVIVQNEKKTQFMTGTVQLDSLSDRAEVAISIGNRKSEVFQKKNVVESTNSVNSKEFEVFYYNQRVQVDIGGKPEIGNTTVYSAATSSTATVKLDSGLITTLSKSRVTKYVEPVHLFKDVETNADEEVMASLFTATLHMSVIERALDGINMSDYEIVKDADWYAFKPKNLKKDEKMPMLIAHTDLHPNLTHPTEDNLEYTKGIFKSPTGLGADDRAGVFAIRKLLISNPREFMVLFPDKEEIGLVGSRAFAKSKYFKEFDKHASMFISIDRRREHDGTKTLATYDCDSDILNTWVSKLTDRKIVRGSSTDCKALSTASSNKVPCFNFSCGYTAEHSKNETLRFSELLTTIADLRKVLNDERCGNTYKYVEAKPAYSRSNAYTPVRSNSMYSSAFDESMEYNDEWYFEDDLKDLLDVYTYFTGETFQPTSQSNILIPELTAGDLVRLDPKLVIGSVYGGQVLTRDIYMTMSKYTWEIESIGDSEVLELIGLNNPKATASQIPRRWVVLVDDEAPLIIL